jgi:type IV pilus assembly protein PilV
MNNQKNKRLESKSLQTCFSKHNGFSMIEALIGFLILSIGMLGIASLQATSLKAGKTSAYNSVAMLKVEELFESMRANPSAAALAAYAAAGAGAGSDNGCSGTKNCNETELAADDVYWWKENITAGLPSGVTTSVEAVPAAAPSRLTKVTVTVNWDERNKDVAGSLAKNYSASANICTLVPC